MTLRIFFLWFIFLCLSLVFRLTLPFGGEPDFLHRVSVILYSEGEFVADLLRFFYHHYSWIPTCESSHTMTNFWGTTSGFLCGESLELKFVRWLLQNALILTLCTIPLIYKVLKTSGCLQSKKFELNTLSIFIALLFPSVIYYTGVAAEEQFTLFISILVIYLVNFPILLLPALYFLYTIELGATMVMVLFLCSYFSIRFLYRAIGVRKTEVVCVIMIFITLFFGIDLLQFLFGVPIAGDKIQLIHYAYTESSYADIMDKYPVVVRPVMMFMTAIFMTPDGIKALLLYPVCGLVLLNVFSKSRRLNRHNGDEDYIILLSIITFIVCTIFVLPGYSNAKYYIFCAPFFVRSALKFYPYYKAVLFCVICSLFVVFILMFSRG